MEAGPFSAAPPPPLRGLDRGGVHRCCDANAIGLDRRAARAEERLRGLERDREREREREREVERKGEPPTVSLF